MSRRVFKNDETNWMGNLFSVPVNPHKLTRVTLVDHRESASSPGIVFEKYGVKVDVVVQDDGRTLKVFVTDAAQP